MEDVSMLWSSPQRKKTTCGPRGIRSSFSNKPAKCHVYYNGKNFALRCIGEQYRLKVLQLVREYNPDRYVHKENGSKNRSRGIGDFNVPNKIVPVYSNPATGVR